MKTLALACAAALAAGCANSPTPSYDARFGEAVRGARLAMTIDPEAGAKGDEARGLDGRAAKEAVKRYQDSFKEPPPVTNVINIGGMVGGGPGK
jgi:hypothetical protein